MKNHAKLASVFLRDESRTDWHSRAVKNFRTKRDDIVKSKPEWEQLRSLAADIKDHVLANLDKYLEQFESSATANGVKVHWASTALDHNKIVHHILKDRQVSQVVKSKSMLTEECHLNEYLEAKGIQIVDTDLGERIIQLRNEPPSHIVAPAIHLKREEVGNLFQKKLGTEPGNNDPTYLTSKARIHLRDKFLQAQAAITGVNFAVAENGTIVIVTNEGNADMGVNLAPIQIHSMGIEKLIPRWIDLSVFTRLLAPSASGQPISIYTSHYRKPKPGSEMHVILVDNGRTDHLAKPAYRSSLRCIRCSACFNTCPVYRRSGGHSYHTSIGGPIGSILMPTRDLKSNHDLPFASSLCGSCSDVCPVKINIHEQLYSWRQEIHQQGFTPYFKKKILGYAGRVLSHPRTFSRMGKRARQTLRSMPRFLIYNRLNTWGKFRELPDAPKYTFTEWYRKNRAK